MEEILRNIAVTVLAAGVSGFFGSAFVKPALFNRFSTYAIWASTGVGGAAASFGLGANNAASASYLAFSNLADQNGVSLPSAARSAFDSKVDTIFDWAHQATILAAAFGAFVVITALLQIYVDLTNGDDSSE